MRATVWLAMMAAFALLVVGCARREETQEQVEYREAAQSRLDRIRADMDSLSARAAASGESLKVEMSVKIEALKAQRDSTEAALDRIKEATGTAWENTKVATDRMLGGLEGAIVEARMRLEASIDTTRASPAPAPKP